MRWRSRLLTGDAAVYDGTNAGVIEAFAGQDWRGLDENGLPVVLNADGDEVTLKPGWAATRADGETAIIVNGPAPWARRYEEIW